MWYENLTVYLVSDKEDFVSGFLPKTAEECLERAKFTEIGKTQLSKSGFISAFESGKLFCEPVNGIYHFALRTDSKILPPSVVNDALKEWADEIELNEGRKPARKERNQKKDEIVIDLLPRAFVKTQVTNAFFDPESRLLVVNESSDKNADQFTAYLREAFGMLPIVPAVGWCHVDLTQMVDQPAALPDLIDLYASDVDLGFQQDRAVKVKFRNVSVESGDVKRVIGDGMHVTQIAGMFSGQMSFHVTNDLKFKSLKFSDTIKDWAADSEDERADALQSAGTILEMLKEFGISGLKYGEDTKQA